MARTTSRHGRSHTQPKRRSMQTRSLRRAPHTLAADRERVRSPAHIAAPPMLIWKRPHIQTPTGVRNQSAGWCTPPSHILHVGSNFACHSAESTSILQNGTRADVQNELICWLAHPPLPQLLWRALIGVSATNLGSAAVQALARAWQRYKHLRAWASVQWMQGNRRCKPICERGSAASIASMVRT